MATEQEVIQSINNTNTSTEAAEASLSAIKTQLNDLKQNPNQPGAQQKLASLKAQYATTAEDIKNIYKNEVVNMAQLYKSSSPDVQKKLNDQYYAAVAGVNTAQNTHSALIGEGLPDLTQPPPATNGQQTTTNNGSDDDAGNASGTETPANPRATTQADFSKPNPLAKFASYNYQISLYVVSSDAYDAFVNSNRKTVNALQNEAGEEVQGGAFLIAQSGGINKANRIEPAFHLDYYIDNLEFLSYVSAGQSTDTAVKFTIYEPYGFSFLTNLRRMRNILGGYNGNKLADIQANQLDMVAANKQFFIIGIRYYGFDENGDPIKETGDSTTTGILEYFYEIVLSKVTFKLENKGTTYFCEGHPIGAASGLGMQRGTLKNGASIEAGKLGDALDALIAQMNKTEQDNNKGKKLFNKFNIAYQGDPEDIKRIKDASMIIPNDQIKASWTGSGATSTSEVNELVSVTASPNKDKKQITVRGETVITQAIEDLFKQSTYLTDAINVLSTTEPNKQTNPKTPKNIKWYKLAVQVSGATWSEERNDWVYNITYIITPYETPGIYSPYINTSNGYYGPHKRYQYWFTGKNTEVLNLEITFNQNYYQVLYDQNPFTKYQEESNVTVPLETGSRTGKPRMGLLNQGLEAQNQVLTSLQDVDAWTNARLTILGDPEFLISDTPTSLSAVYNKYYAGNGTINANHGYVFIELEFKEAIDYDITTGELKLNDSILFWKYPKSIADAIKGIILQVTAVKSKFQGGRFTQTLETVIPGFLDPKDSANYGTGTFVNPKEARADSTREAAKAEANRQNLRYITPQDSRFSPASPGQSAAGSPFLNPNAGLTPEATQQLVTAALTPAPGTALPLPAAPLSTGDD